MPFDDAGRWGPELLPDRSRDRAQHGVGQEDEESAACLEVFRIAKGERGQTNGKDLGKIEDRINKDLKGILDGNKETKPGFQKSEAKYDNKPGSDARGEAKNDTNTIDIRDSEIG